MRLEAAADFRPGRARHCTMRDLVVALIATLAVQTFASFSVFTPPILAPMAQTDVGVAASAIGIFTSCIYFLATLSAPIGGTFVARHGPVRVSQACLLFAAAGMAICTLAHPLALLAGAVAIGCGYGPVTPASSALLVERTPPQVRNLIMSIRQTGVPVGGAIAGATVPAVMLAVGWRGAAFVIALLCVALAVALQPLRRAYDRPSGTAAPRPSLAAMLRMVLRHPGLRRVSLASFTYASIQMCFATFLVVFLTERAGRTLVEAGAALASAMVGGIVGRILWGVVADRLGNARIVLGALGLAMAGGTIVLAQVTAAWPYWGVVALCVFTGASAIGWNGVYVAEVARIAPGGEVALATGASLGMTYFGVVVGPLAFWLVIALSESYVLAYTLVGIFTGAAAMTYFRKDRMRA